MLVLTSIGALGGLSLLLVTLLVLAHRKLHVDEDPRIDDVEEMLPHANCGACGFPGCRPFAEALVTGAAHPGKCTVSTDDGRTRIAAFLGVDVGAEEKRVARLACAGGVERRPQPGALRGARVLPRGGAGRRRRQGLLLGLPRTRRLRGGLRLRRDPDERARRCRWSTRRSAPPAATASRPVPRISSRSTR